MRLGAFTSTAAMAGPSLLLTACGGEGNSSSQTTPPDTTPPSVPTLTLTSNSSTSVGLSWTVSTDTGGSGLAGYHLSRGSVIIDTTTATSYTDSTVSPSTSYSYTVAAYDTSGNSSAASVPVNVTTPAAPDTTPPSVPSLNLTSSTPSSVSLSWTTSTDSGGSGVAGYRLFRGGALIATTAATSYVDSTVNASTSYAYTVVAYDNAGNSSAASTPLNVITPAVPDTVPPSVPNLSSTLVTATQVALAWTASTDTGGSGLAGYRLSRGGTLITTTASTTYSDSAVNPSTSYTYTVVAYDNAGNVSAPSTPLKVTTPALPDTTPPTVPGSLTAIATGATIVSLSWAASTDSGGSGLAGYRVLRGGTVIGTTNVATTSYADSTANPSTTYSYAVVAFDGAGNTSAPSAPVSVTTPAAADTTPPSVPTLNLTSTASTSLGLSWTASVDNSGGSGLAGYHLYRNAVLVSSPAAGVQSYTDTGLTPLTSYSYTISAFDADGNVSASSPALIARTAADTTPPSVPGSLTATAAGQTQINLTWQASTDTGGSGLAGYRVYRNGNLVNTGGLLGGTNFSDTGLAAGTTYSYTVRAVDVALNESTDSNTATATTAAAASPPTVVTTIPGSGASSVGVNAQLSVTFSTTMTTSTITTSSFALTTTSGGVPVAGTVSANGNGATFTPSAALAAGTQYTATITTAVQDSTGLALAANYSWMFTTAAGSAPHLGGHGLGFKLQGPTLDPVSTPAFNTQSSGSTIVVCVGRGDWTLFHAPTDNWGNTYTQVDILHNYVPLYTGSGTGLYSIRGATGGTGTVVSETNTASPTDEVTVAAVEVVNGTTVQSVWNEVQGGNPQTTLSITTTGPATLIAFWWGDAPGNFANTAVPDSGFNVIDSVLQAGGLVQCAVATRDVAAAGTYSLTWTANLNQGAQLWLVAVQ